MKLQLNQRVGHWDVLLWDSGVCREDKRPEMESEEISVQRD